MTRHIPFAFTAFLALAAAACSGNVADEPGSEPGDNSEESALSTSELSNVAAVRVERDDTVIVGAPSKVAKVLKAFRKSGGSAPLCASMGRATKFTLYDIKGADIGSGSMFCFRGHLHMKSGNDIGFVTRPGDLDVLQEAPVVADALWGVTKIHGRSAGKQADFTKKADLDSFIGAIGIEQKLGPSLPVMRCPSNHGVQFFRGEKQIGELQYNCGATPPAKLEVNFNAADPNDPDKPFLGGSISIHAKDIEDMIQAAPAAE